VAELDREPEPIGLGAMTIDQIKIKIGRSERSPLFRRGACEKA
jgi:hypothetical protein